MALHMREQILRALLAHAQGEIAKHDDHNDANEQTKDSRGISIIYEIRGS